MTTHADYNNLVSELIQKQIAIAGPDVTLEKVQKIEGLIIDKNGVVTHVEGDEKVILQKLIATFTEMSGDIVKKAYEPIFAMYPHITQGLNLLTSDLVGEESSVSVENTAENAVSLNQLNTNVLQSAEKKEAGENPVPPQKST